MKKSLVIGGSGFLGAALAGELQQRGEDVRVFDLYPNPHVFSIIGDIREPDDILRACEGVDTVYHTAALVDWGPRSRQKLLDVNVTGARHVIATCRDFYFSNEKAKRHFDYRLLVPPDQAYHETLNWLKKTGWERR